MASLSPTYSAFVPTPPVLAFILHILFFSTLLTYFMLYLNKMLTKGKTCSTFIVSLGTKYLPGVFFEVELPLATIDVFILLF